MDHTTLATPSGRRILPQASTSKTTDGRIATAALPDPQVLTITHIGAVSLGYTPAGKRNRPKASGKTKAEVRQKLRELKKELANGGKAPANYSVEQAVNDWLAQGLKGREVTSVDTYKSLAENHIIPQLGTEQSCVTLKPTIWMSGWRPRPRFWRPSP
ncbi:hypothetical protein [Streptomyces sp. KR55]|uniref:hypothetical protein n=1 Tax=Streptomyces sp. KR55 TaxID=3457425 RepID=UPI003FD6A005